MTPQLGASDRERERDSARAKGRPKADLKLGSGGRLAAARPSLKRVSGVAIVRRFGFNAWFGRFGSKAVRFPVPGSVRALPERPRWSQRRRG